MKEGESIREAHEDPEETLKVQWKSGRRDLDRSETGLFLIITLTELTISCKTFVFLCSRQHRNRFFDSLYSYILQYTSHKSLYHNSSNVGHVLLAFLSSHHTQV